MNSTYYLEKIENLLKKFSQSTGYSVSFLDAKTKEILLAVGWSDVCNDFHCACVDSIKWCQDIGITSCKHDMIDVAIPIKIDDEHIASIFVGQVYLNEPNMNFYIENAKKYGYDKDKYLKALGNVKIVNEDEFKKNVDFLRTTIDMISELITSNQKLLEKYKKEEKIASELKVLNNNLGEKLVQKSLELEDMTSLDSLTGLYNRKKFFELAHEMKNKWKVFSSIMIDFDNFKKVNDRYGHKVGDMVLKEVVSKIKNMLPKGSIFSRIGGDEFIVICESYDYEMDSLMAKISKEIRESCMLDIVKSLNVSLSYGISTLEKDENFDSLFNRTDKKLYKMKKQNSFRDID